MCLPDRAGSKNTAARRAARHLQAAQGTVSRPGQSQRGYFHWDAAPTRTFPFARLVQPGWHAKRIERTDVGPRSRHGARGKPVTSHVTMTVDQHGRE